MNLDIVVFTVATGFDTKLAINTVRLPLYRAVAEQLNGKGKVLVVTRPVTLRPNRFEGLAGTASRLMQRRLVKQGPNLFSLSPLLPMPMGALMGFPAAFRALRSLFGWQVRRAIRRLNMGGSSLAVTVNDPFHYHLLGLAGESLAIYDCIDDHPHQSSNGWEPDPEVTGWEEQLLKRLDLVFATSRALAHRLGEQHDNVRYIPNGVDYDFFHRATLDSTPVAIALRGLPRPIVGFMGNLCDWYDFPLLRGVVKARPRWSFVFIGWADAVSPSDPLRRLPNAHFRGRQEFELLPSFLKGFDAAIMPYQMSPVAKAVNPDKMYQYMAAGVPVVSTPIPEAAQFSDVIEIADDVDCFLRALETCVFGDNRQRIARQTAIARGETWGHRALLHLELIQAALGRHSNKVSLGSSQSAQ